MTAQETELLSIAEAEALIASALVANAVPSAAAASVAKALVAAEAEGHVGHGFSRLADYIAQARTGKVRADAVPIVQRQGAAALRVDAGFGFAYPALDLAIAEGVAMAREAGVATMAVTRSHHCGALSVQVDRIARHGLIGLMVANTPVAIAPWGSSTPLFGTNPIAFAAPRAGAAPLVIDLSLSRVARGKVMHAKRIGASIPEGWALDADGNPTTDPDAGLAGSMVPIGEAKGSALALMVEVLAAVLTGANLSSQMSSFFTADGPPPGGGQFLMAIRPGDADGFAAGLDHLLGAIEATEGARVPGVRRAEALARAERDGITVAADYVAQARAFAEGTA